MSAEGTVLGVVIQAFFSLVLAYLLGLRKDRLTRQMEVEANRTLERLRSELARSELEHSVRFTRLHQKRATVIATTYALMDKVDRSVRAMMQFVSTAQERPEGWNDALAAYRKLDEYWSARSIWLEATTNEAIRPVVNLVRQPIRLLAWTKDRDVADLREAIAKAERILQERVPAARQVMEEALRKVLSGSPAQVAP